MRDFNIKPNQIWKQKASNFQIVIDKKKGDKWQVKVLTNRPGIYRDTHTMSAITIAKRFELIV